jgi:telomerase reverse transcriptase
MSKTDETKRRQLLAEFIYWLFDSFIIPLLRSHFYITESGVDRNRVFYFRHDVWKKLSEPALDRLKINLFEEMKGDYAEKILAGRKLGFSQVRLLPKENGVRPIMNLRKKGVRKVSINGVFLSVAILADYVQQNGKIRLIPGINAIMTPVFRVLVFEKVFLFSAHKCTGEKWLKLVFGMQERKPERIGHSMFSVGDMYLRMKDFQARIVEKGWQNQKLYFAKVDVQACFDTIPQSKLLRLVRSIMGEEEYRIDKYAEVCPPPAHQIPNKQGLKRPVKKFIANAKPTDEIDHFADYAETVAKNLKPGTVLVDDVLPRSWERPELIELLKTHIQENVIKVGGCISSVSLWVTLALND